MEQIREIRVIHIGEDYGKLEIVYVGQDPQAYNEYEVSLPIARAIQFLTAGKPTKA